LRRLITQDAVIEKVNGGAIVNSQERALLVALTRNGLTGLSEIDMPGQFTERDFVGNLTAFIEKRNAESTVTETSTRTPETNLLPLLGLGVVSVNDSLQSLPCNFLSNFIFHLDQKETAISAIRFVYLKNGVPRCAGSSKGIQDYIGSACRSSNN
jgi:hypothetical protein